MKKIFEVILIGTLFFSCGFMKKPKDPAKKDSLSCADSAAVSVDSIKTSQTRLSAGDSVGLLEYSQYVVNAIKRGDINQLATYVHPSEGVRLSPYGYIDVKNDRKLSPDELVDRYNSNNVYLWGYFDGTGFGIKLTCKEYFHRFVYDVDFENQSTTSLNECKVGGNSQNNLPEIYQGLNFVEYFYPGTKNMENMDWKVLRLVYKMYNSQFYLVGIVHDEWTI